MKPIDLLVPELFAADGGIQRYSHTLIKALQMVRPHTPLRVFIRNDQPHHLPLKGWPGISWYPARGSSIRMARSLARAARRQRPQLLLSTHPNFAPLQVLHHRLTGSPSWCSAHGIEVWRLGRGPKCWALERLERLLPVSRFTAARLQRQLGDGCPPLGVLPNSFDQTLFSLGARSPQLLQRYGLHPNQPLIFTLSRLSQADAYKNIHRLIKALPALMPRWPDLRLMIAGEGDDKHRLQSLAAQIGVGQQVIFSGRIAEQELVDHHRLATVFALPSTGEGFGIVFLEALGCGRPVLAGNRDGSVDPLDDGRFGLLVDPHLPLAPALASLLARQGEDLWFQPEALAQAVGEAFGFGAFCDRLDAQLATLEVS
jgi:glycosyltransferase involved in cell wall biosynthesis